MIIKAQDMSPRNTHILVLDDETDILEEIKEFLQIRKHPVHLATRPSEAFSILKSHTIDIAILDIRLPEMGGLEVLRRVRKNYPNIQPIMISGHGDMDAVIQALRLGAVDFFRKPFLLNEMYQSIEKASKHSVSKAQLNGDQFEYALKQVIQKDTSTSLIVAGQSMMAVVDKMKRVARSKDTTVLITGESGTGKELIAKGIHYLSSRSDKPFHAVNCSTIPDELFESEFFGFTKGAFTGAVNDKPGWFEAADGGTLFLDEIGDLKPGLQAKLLRVMEDKHISRLGSTSARKIDVRVVAATNQDLGDLIEQKKFRSDLYHRINTFVIHIPPLRERPESIPLLIDHDLEYFSHKLDRQVPLVDGHLMEALAAYDYPGNVRELKHMMERGLILCEGDTLTLEHFDHLKLKLPGTVPGAGSHSPYRSLEEQERESIESALKQCRYNKSAAARLLNISRQALDRRIARLGIVVR